MDLASKIVLASFASLVLGVACNTSSTPTESQGGSGTQSASGCTATIASIQEKLFAVQCATSGCHSGAKPSAGLDLGSPGVEARLVDVASTCGKPLVAPGDPAGSILTDKLANATPSCGGSQMPPAGALEAGDLACVTGWISSLPRGDGGATTDGGGVPITCGANETACAGVCVNTSTDPNHCGACGNACGGAAKFCVSGACSATCPLKECSGACVDVQTDSNNCGDCGIQCTGGKICQAGSCTCGSSPVTLATIQSSIFTPGCLGQGCHQSVKVGPKTLAPAEGLDLSSTALSFQGLVNKASTCAGKTLVVPNDVAASYLINKLTGSGMSCGGSKMPKGGSLTAAEIDSVRNWICNGAQNN